MRIFTVDEILNDQNSKFIIFVREIGTCTYYCVRIAWHLINSQHNVIIYGQTARFKYLKVSLSARVTLIEYDEAKLFNKSTIKFICAELIVRIAIFGASQGLGRLLLEYFYATRWEVINLSRSSLNARFNNIYCDVTLEESIKEAIGNINAKIDVMVYCPACWGESGNLEAKELNDFLNTGPVGFLRICHGLIKQKRLAARALIVSIGSIAVDNLNKSEIPAYTLSKLLQEKICAMLQASL